MSLGCCDSCDDVPPCIAPALQFVSASASCSGDGCSLSFPAYPDFYAPGTTPPSYSTGQGEDTRAERGWVYSASPPFDLLGKDEQKIQWRVNFYPSGTCYQKVWVAAVFTPTGGSPEAPSISSKEWIGTGNPCFDPAASFEDISQVISSSPTEVGVPATNGVVDVTILKWSCVPGYEPDISDPENPQPNGFPDPTWEAAPP